MTVAFLVSIVLQFETVFFQKKCILPFKGSFHLIIQKNQ